MKAFLLKNKLTGLGMIVGAILGYLYYYFWGCAGGSCSITSDPTNSTVYGLIMGALLFSIFETNNKK